MLVYLKGVVNNLIDFPIEITKTKEGHKAGTKFSAQEFKNLLWECYFPIGLKVFIKERDPFLNKKPNHYFVYDGDHDQVLFSHQKEFQNAGKNILENKGWRVWLLGSERRTASGIRNFVDMIALGNNMSAFFEVKFGTDYMSKNQIELKEEIDPLTGDHLFYRIATRLDHFREVAHENK